MPIGTLVLFSLHSQMVSALSFEQAVSSRDALAKAMYSRTFTWLVEKINHSLAPKVKPPGLKCDKNKLNSQGEFGPNLFPSVTQDELHRSTKSSTVIGLLDIYGFEVLQHNRYH